MLNIKTIEKQDMKQSEYNHKYGRGQSYVVLENDRPIAYIWFEIKNHVMDLTMIEVIEKGKGKGKKIIHFLFDHFSLEKITGFVLCEERAYKFWDSLGATFYYVEEEGYIDIYEILDAELESAFTLTLSK